MNLTEAIDWAVDRLNASSIEEARFEAELLLTGALGLKKSELILYQSKIIEDKSFKCYQELVKRRLKHEPTAYILGSQPFLGLDIIVNRSVLIPRPETELLAETAIKIIRSHPLPPTPYPLTIADIGTGSGCIAVYLAKQFPAAQIIGIDSSAAAITVAKQNAKRLGVADRCQFVVGNLLDPLKNKVDLIVANPPYIPTKDIAGLQPEVRDWEPRKALDGGGDGLDYIRKLLEQAARHLTAEPSGSLLIEFGFGQAEKINELAKKQFASVTIKKDLAGIDRFLFAANRVS